MQPYFFPYLGYFQLINAVDKFVIYDNVQFTKRGWFNRNRLFLDGKVEYFSINISKDSDFLDVRERKISSVFFNKESNRILRKIEKNYKQAPFFNAIYPIIKSAFQYDNNNLFEFIYNSLRITLNYLKIDTEIIVSSTLPLDHTLKNKYRVFDIYRYLEGTKYINPSGGHKLYNKQDFESNRVNLCFLQQMLPKYNQLNTEEFISGLSIIDVMMFNSLDEIRTMLTEYDLT